MDALQGSPCVFCSVTAVTADAPKTPRAANVLRSACMPAPPPESEPAMVSTRGTCITDQQSIHWSHKWCTKKVLKHPSR